ncbi:MAG TPA: methyltransferase domain-containing protein [Bacteroidota bacterium]|nr:methyltransferase domain-containing protein [Bacteroidota bacterium]
MEILSDQLTTLIEQPTGHIIPQLSDPLLAVEHYHRYLYALRFVTGKRVLDVGCGDGYGAAFLSLAASEVLGVDVSESAIQQARQKYVEFSNARFEAANCVDMRLVEQPFDVITCYQTFEHLDGEEQVRCMESMKNVLAPKGIIVASTRDRSAQTSSPSAPGLKHQLSAVEFYEFLKRYFKNVIFVGQKPLMLSAMWSLHGWQDDSFALQAREGLFSPKEEGEQFTEPTNIIAVCSDEYLPRLIADSSNSFYFDSKHEIQVKDVLSRSKQLETEMESLRAEITRMRKEYSQSTDVVQKLYAENISLKNANAEFQIAIEERTTALHRLENSIAERNDVMEKLQNEHATFGTTIATLTEDNSGLNAWVRELQTQLEDQALRAQRNSEEYEKASAALSVAQQQANEYQALFTALDEEHVSVKNHFAELQRQADSAAHTSSQEIERLMEHINALMLDLERARTSSKYVNDQHEALQTQHRELLQRFDEQLLSVSKGRDEVEGLRKQVGEIIAQLDEQTTFSQLYSEENDSLKKQLAELQMHDDQERNLAKNMFRENEELKAQIAELQKNAASVAELTGERAALVEQLHKLQQEKESHATEILAVEEGFKTRVDEADTVLRQVEEQKIAMRQMRNDMEKQAIAFDTYQKSQGDLQQRYNKSQIRVQELTADISMLEQKLERISHNPAYKVFSSMGVFPKGEA